MLILTRKIGQSIIIGENVEVKIVSIEEGKVKLGITAPKEVTVLRKELIEVMDENIKAASVSKEAVKEIEKFIKKR
ncbi:MULTISPECIES: carbon storage regulator CsrA [Thermoanaerobacteraceae]|uniref:Translational regulator CsrA n=3 Tax=Thermoanaerobacteraceae TaxID=186814 RepID=Q8RCD4_CALS4|nr:MULTISPECIES: carbon storage regulator CsrA [Thermoanaerobacteraceae]AAM23778.1 Carbon storage regulator (could also regulate swarming and quorum sensing) [Caldanaerobacter subterraneus subsp. tengcongensis MB4]AIS51684.1 carbon storage regulator [Thermoanaerobacter kivui]MCS3916727.1 carbon storage regulator [Caldanaerobacter subterraneus subsp. tengcongensis MB4]TCO67602.1 carbon storage regulator CsrA [Caldanaerobacter subterraneus]